MSRALALVLVAVVLALGIAAVAAASSDAATRVDNVETHTVSGSTVELNDSRLAQVVYDRGENVTVANATDGSEYVLGTDWAWNHSDGVVVILSGGNISDGEDVEVSYGYDRYADTAWTLNALFVTGIDASTWLPLVLGAALALGAAATFAGVRS